MKKFIVLLVSATLTISLLAQDKNDQVVKRIDRLLDKAYKKENVHNLFISIYAPSSEFEWHAVKGAFKDGREVNVDNPFYTASIGKTFTATAISMLVEEGKIGFDDRISSYLSEETMQGLHILNGIDYKDSLTVSQLLQHTSGLPDYFEDTEDGTPGMLDQVVMDTGRFWQPDELIRFSKEHFTPTFAPGTGYRYTDTEYVLLGMIIENVSEMKLHEFFAVRILEPLQMEQTYLNLRSSVTMKTDDMAEMYAGTYEISSFTSLSADWAGGAIVSTGNDLIRFHRALLGGELISQKTLQQMQQWVPETRGMSYGYGLRKISFKELSAMLPKWQAIGHSGLNGSIMYYVPELDVFIAGTLNQLEASKDATILMARILMELRKL